MSLSSYLFIFAFLPVALIGFRMTRHRGWADLWLIGASVVFYCFAGPVAVMVVLISAIANYVVSTGLTRLTTPKLQTLALAGAIAANLLVLGHFKYFSSMVRSIAPFLHLEAAAPELSLPLGISFFTFQQIAYLIDIQVKQAAIPRFRHYLLFVTFFPQASSGPINYWHETIPQYQRMGPGSGSAVDFSVGLSMFAFGLFKKTVLASSLAQFADPVFDGGSRSIGFLNAWTAAMCYGLQLYFDFSGYSDMAIGAARMFGVRLPINFNSPLKAVNLIDFWRRWHMTMTRFFTDYVYSPLALRWTRESVLRRDPRVQQFVIGVALPTLISFVLIGWWHGAQWTFIVFGFVHGLALTVNQAWRRLRWPAPPRLVGWAITFCIFTVSVVLVRAPSMEQAVAVYQAMAGAQVPGFAALIAELRHAWTLPEGQGKVMLPLLGLLSRLTHAPELLLYLTALVSFCWAMPNTVQVMSHYRPALTDVYRGYSGAINWRPDFCWSIAVAAILAFAILNISHVQPFIYIQF